MGLDVSLLVTQPVSVFDAGITHNLNTMAREANLYKHLWRPEELGYTQANQLIEGLTKGLKELKDKPDYYKTLNPGNGWGDYDGLVKFVENYLQACIDNPDAEIYVSR